MNTTSVDAYLQDGCGRCDLYQTPACKVHRWTSVLIGLRAMLRASGLVEEMKWGSPCYTLDGANVAMLVSLKERCALQFFKGVALADPDGELESAGPNSRFVRLLAFRSVEEFEQRKARAAWFLDRAIALERDGTPVVVPPAQEPVPAELEQRLEQDPELAQAFAALTPGRRRSHILHVSGAKQSDTRARRVERCVPEILAGRGFNER